MAIDQKLVDHYWDKGWVVVEGIFSRQEAEAVGQLAVQHASDDTKLGTKSASREYDGQGKVLAPRKLDRPFLVDPRFRQTMLDPRLRAWVDALLGDAGLPVTDQIFLKPPRHGSAKPYHQDNFYFKCEPDDAVLTAWIALDDCDESNGCLRYIDGSHRGPILPHTAVPGEPHNLAPKPELIDLSRESLAIVKKGGVVFHHGKTLHTSHRNHSDRWRRGYATHWVAPGTTSTSSVLDNPYYKLPELAPA